MYARVINKEERFERRWVEGIGKDAKFIDAPLGWYIHFEGSFESLCFGMNEPRFEIGEMIKINFEHIDE